MERFTSIGLCLLVLSCSPGGNGGPSTAPATAAPADAGAPISGIHGEDAPAGTQERDPVPPHQSTGQLLYVSAYSHVYSGPDQRPFNLACTLSIRNVDLRSPIVVTSVDYYNTTGELVRSFLDQPRTLAPLETVDYYIKERDTTGGSGANFIVRWHADAPVNAPVVETVMIGVDAGQGISFVCPAREISG